ncbi:hypothetical protein [[Clostridium] colinum]|uniref:hypothetical protein n=1 Tax=[Clostridium] colinum TaxID=36835 RepID=UPI0020257B23|nr:hypothetical protein [[Clostridium] colinum]
MELENNIDFNNISYLLNIIKENKNKENSKENNLLKINSINNIKSILPLLGEDNDNIYKILNYLEINQLLSKYKEAHKNIDKEQVLDLKKEAILHIKQNVNENNKYIADLFLKAMEMKSILNKNYRRGDI